MKIFSIYDTKAEFYNKPFYSKTVGAAVRSVSDLVNSNDNDISSHPEDFVLFHIGEFDEQTGLVKPLASPQNLGVAIEFKE